MKRILIVFTYIIVCGVFAQSAQTTLRNFSLGNILYKYISKENHKVAVIGFKEKHYDEPILEEIIIPNQVVYNSEIYDVTEMRPAYFLFNDVDEESIDDVNSDKIFPMDYANAGCAIPKKLIIPGSIEKIGDIIFLEYAHNLTEVYIEDGSLQEIGHGSFSICYNLISVRLPDNLKYIHNRAFRYNPSLSEINIPQNVESIGDEAFYGINNNYWEPYYDEGDTDLDWDTRSGSSSSVSPLILPNTLKHLGHHAFFDSNGKWDNALVLSTSLDSIGKATFSFTSLQDLIIPNSVRSIDKRAFNNISTHAYHGGYAYKKEFMPRDLTRLTLGTAVESVADDAFGEAPYLKEFYCLPSNPPSFVFSGFNPNATVLVPPGKLDLYRNAEGWNHFKNFKELPNVLIQFQIKKYYIASGESAELRYIISNLADANIVSEEWRVEDSDHNPADDALAIEDGYVKGLQSGDYYLTLTLTDDAGEQYSATAVVLVDSNGSGVEEIYGDDTQENSDLTKVYNLQGTFVGTSTCGLAPGLYIVKDGSDTKKVLIK